MTETITSENIDSFARVTGDANPVHLDEDFASKTQFKHRIAHGMLGAAYISRVIGTELPGSIYIHQDLNFKKPVYIGDTAMVTVEVTEYRPDKEIVLLNTKVKNQKDEEVITGKAVIMVKGVRENLARLNTDDLKLSMR